MPHRRLLPVLALAGVGAWFLLSDLSDLDAPREPDAPPVERAPPRRTLPPGKAPTEHRLAEDAEETNKQRRKEWFAEMHRAPPDVDWRAIERQNGLAQVAKRNALARSGDVRMAYGAKWVERGSDNQAGRMHVTTYSTDGATLYAGSSRGGVWRSDPDGESWTPLGDNLYGGAHWLEVVHDGNRDVMLAATDYGLIHRSADDGATWEVPSGLPSGIFWVRRMQVTSDGSDLIFLVVGHGASRYSLLRSSDAGASFEEVFDLSTYAGDVWIPRDGGERIFLLYADDIVASADHGETWIGVGTVPGGLTAGELAGSEAGPVLYAAVDDDQGRPVLHRSGDGGASWEELRMLEDYWDVLVASTVDPDRVAWGGVELHVSRDGGAVFDVVNNWWTYYDDPVTQLHADIMGVDVFPDGAGGEEWYINTDGGVYRSVDGLETVDNLALRGLRVSQYYSTLTDVSDPTKIAAGAQDQGYQLTTGLDQTSEVYDFDQIISGDYGHLTSPDGTHELVVSVYPGTILVQMGAWDAELAWLAFPEEGARAWLPPVVAQPSKKNQHFFFGAQQLWRFEHIDGAEWRPEVWTTDFAFTGGEYISALTFSPLDDELAWVATSFGRLYRSTDKGKSWKESDDLAPNSHYLYGSAMEASLTDPEVVYVGGSGYNGPSVLRSKNGGKTWKAYDDGMPPTMVYCLCEAPDSSGVLFAGTEQAVYRRDPDSDGWVDVTGADAPITTYWSCEALQHENTIRFGTYGRGIWDYQLDPEYLGCFPPIDRDGDGSECPTDCNDDDPAIYPGAEEACDGVDMNCDPTDVIETDEDLDGLMDCAPLVWPEVPEKTGCGCAVGDTYGAPWLLGLLVLARRRRRS